VTSEKGIQIRLSSITTERDEVEISGALVANQLLSHGILDRILSRIGSLRMGVCCVRRDPGLRGETWGTLFFVYSVRGHPPGRTFYSVDQMQAASGQPRSIPCWERPSSTGLIRSFISAVCSKISPITRSTAFTNCCLGISPQLRTISPDLKCPFVILRGHVISRF